MSYDQNRFKIKVKGCLKFYHTEEKLGRYFVNGYEINAKQYKEFYYNLQRKRYS